MNKKLTNLVETFGEDTSIDEVKYILKHSNNIEERWVEIDNDDSFSFNKLQQEEIDYKDVGGYCYCCGGNVDNSDELCPYCKCKELPYTNTTFKIRYPEDSDIKLFDWVYYIYYYILEGHILDNEEIIPYVLVS